MAQSVDPSPNSTGHAYLFAQAIANHGAVGDGWIVPSDETYATTHNSSGVADGPLGAFAHTATSGLDVTFDTGEAFIVGAWMAKDTQTTVSLADNTSNQLIEVGWDAEAGDTVLIGERGTTVGDSFTPEDPSLPLYQFDTDSGGVSASSDRRKVGKEFEFDITDLGDGTTIGRYLLTALQDSAVGTPGDQKNELFRAGTSVSDLVVHAETPDRVAIAWNAYHDGGAWRFITGNERAYKISFGGDEIQLYLSSVATGAAGDQITWNGFDLNSGGLHDQTGQTIYDDNNDTVPQGILGGPASSLSGYPIPSGDIDDGTDSGLDADTLRGNTPEDLQESGPWAEIDYVTGIDTGSPLEYDSGNLSTTYDMYRLDIYREAHGDTSSSPEQRLRVNGNGSSIYDYDKYDGENDVGESHDAETSWGAIAEIENGAGNWVMQTVVLSCPKSSNRVSDPGGTYPYIWTPSTGTGKNNDYLMQGHMESSESEIYRVQLFGGGDATGKVRLLGRSVW